MMRGVCALIVPCLVLGACSETSMLQYQGRPAQTALECEAAYEASRQNGAAVPIGASGAAIAGAAIGTGIAAGMREEHYKTCLARVAALPGAAATRPASVSASAPAQLPGSRAVATTGVRQEPRVQLSGCGTGSNVFSGGTGYCIGQ